MKYLILYLLLAMGLSVHAQLPGFPPHANGLLYSDTLMGQLRHLADSVRSHARRARVEGKYYSVRQTTGRVVRVDTGNVYRAFDELRGGISYEAFVANYPQADTDSKILVLLQERPGYQVAGNADYLKIPVEDRVYNGTGRIILETDEHYRPLADSARHRGFNDTRCGITGNCVYSFSREPHNYKGKYTDDPYVFAYFLDSAPSATRFTGTAARLIAWRDRIVDTGNNTYYKDAGFGGAVDLRDKDFGPAQKDFDTYIEQHGAPVVIAYHLEHPKANLMDDFRVRQQHTDSIAGDTSFRRLLGAAITEIEEKHYYPFIYLERYMDDYAPAAALDIRRRWIPVVTDNFDQITPRLSALHIAYLAAELGNWGVFLHAHLAIAIDPSGQYPDLTRPLWRNTFLRELEVLNIGIDEILLGNELASPWPDASFYRATRLGRSLALEGGDKIKLEQTLLKLIADKGLDDYHRLEMHYLFLNYVSFEPDEKERNTTLARLVEADKTLPGYLSARVRVNEQAVNKHMDLPAW